RTYADVAHRRGRGSLDGALAQIEEPAAGLRDLERHARRREKGRLEPFAPDALLVIGGLRHLHRLADARVRGAVVVDEANEIGSQVVGLGDHRHRRVARVLALRDPTDHRCERRAHGPRVRGRTAAAGDSRRRRGVVAEGAQRPLDEPFVHGIGSVYAGSTTTAVPYASTSVTPPITSVAS